MSESLQSSPDGFEDSVLALYLGRDAEAVRARGDVQRLAAGQSVPRADPQVLHVVMAGTVEDSRGWHGPGNHLFGDDAIRVTSESALLWTLDRRHAGLGAALGHAVETALQAAAHALQAATPPVQLPEPDTLCDVDHSEIRRHAARLMRGSEEATAEAIFLFVQSMPYRFGAWQERASDTLARGTGMCTTKANLQTALLRASGLEAGFVGVHISMDVLGLQMPPAWLAMMRPQVKHYFGAVRLAGRWHAADSSYTDDSLGVYIRAFPWMSGLERGYLGAGRPFSPIAMFNRTDPFDLQVVSHLQDAMSKKSRFAPRHFEALNTRLDRLHGTWRRWLPQGDAALAGSGHPTDTETHA